MQPKLECAYKLRGDKNNDCSLVVCKQCDFETPPEFAGNGCVK
jgi:hypothetical protein